MATDVSYVSTTNKIESESAGWIDRFIWAVLLAFAWIVFEITANATLSILLACLRFGANDLQTAYWLWKEDPQRARARACAAFFCLGRVENGHCAAIYLGKHCHGLGSFFSEGHATC